MKKLMLAAAVLSLGTMAEATSGFEGYATMTMTAITVEGQPWIEFSVQSILAQPTGANEPGGTAGRILARPNLGTGWGRS